MALKCVFSMFLEFPHLFINLARFSQTGRLFGRNLLFVEAEWRDSEGVLPKTQKSVQDNGSAAVVKRSSNTAWPSGCPESESKSGLPSG